MKAALATGAVGPSRKALGRLVALCLPLALAACGGGSAAQTQDRAPVVAAAPASVPAVAPAPQREVTWRRNCVAIGLSSGFLEPLESTSIHLIQRGVIRLMQMFPAAGIRQSDVDEYNRQTRDEMEHIRDCIILHYHVSKRSDVAFWRDCRSMDVPASLGHRIRLFSETARVFRGPNELFAENSWIQVMLGQGITPGQHHPVLT